MMFVFFFFKQKTAYEMRISDWSSDVCSSDLFVDDPAASDEGAGDVALFEPDVDGALVLDAEQLHEVAVAEFIGVAGEHVDGLAGAGAVARRREPVANLGLEDDPGVSDPVPGERSVAQARPDGLPTGAAVLCQIGTASG